MILFMVQKWSSLCMMIIVIKFRIFNLIFVNTLFMGSKLPDRVISGRNAVRLVGKTTIERMKSACRSGQLRFFYFTSEGRGVGEIQHVAMVKARNHNFYRSNLKRRS
ncbi:hypothetical protein DEX24_08815 [Kurthia sibirica]|uniref:Uncharacterized protein n=1 Tax=Kurthia sibirica TaxID=202750 RepID=A0A2U3ALP4_9BACL|nr:hypothetical protein DEX24_08815 [Kurthia sibirica]